MSRKVFLLAVVFLLLAAPLARAESGKTLTQSSASFDNKTVSFKGEVIGVMVRGSYAWVNLLDNGFAIGVWCRAEDARKVAVTGDYRHIGDTVEVFGTFHMACLDHGGDLDIHSDSFTVLANGRFVERTPDLLLIGLSIALIAIAIVVTFSLRRLRAERKRQHYLFEG